MDEQRKAWCKKYEVRIADGGFVDKYCLPEHVQYVLPSIPGQKPYFIGFDGKIKQYQDLTEEEKQDYNEQQKRIPQLLNEFVNRKEGIGKEPGE